MKLKWFTNTKKHQKRRYGQSTSDYEDYLKWISQWVVGDPDASEKYTVEQLKEMGMIGLYEKVEANE